VAPLVLFWRTRLANTPKRPPFFLVETGGKGLPTERRQPYQRYQNAFALPDLEYGYTTVPQQGLDRRQLTYQRGKGLGGSSMINFMVYTRGPAADWDRWADLVGDQDWSWEKTKQRFCQVRCPSTIPATKLTTTRLRHSTIILIKLLENMLIQKWLIMDIMAIFMFQSQRKNLRMRLRLPWMLVRNWE